MAENDFIKVDIQGLPELRRKLDKLPDTAKEAGSDEAYNYMLGLLKKYPSYKYVSRKSAYGVTFFSDAQRRYVMGAIGRGEIVPGRSNRTGALGEGWQKHGTGSSAYLANAVPYAPYVVGDQSQSRHEKAVGWKMVSESIGGAGKTGNVIGYVIKGGIKAIVDKFNVGVEKAIRKLGL